MRKRKRQLVQRCPFRAINFNIEKIKDAAVTNLLLLVGGETGAVFARRRKAFWPFEWPKQPGMAVESRTMSLLEAFCNITTFLHTQELQTQTGAFWLYNIIFFSHFIFVLFFCLSLLFFGLSRLRFVPMEDDEESIFRNMKIKYRRKTGVEISKGVTEQTLKK